MIKVILKLKMVRICLMSFILLCSVLTSENVFSLKWDRNFAKVSYNPKANTIRFTFSFHHYSVKNGENGYLESGVFQYAANGTPYTELLSVSTKNQKGADRVSITVHNKRDDEDVRFLAFNDDRALTRLPANRDVTIDVNTVICKSRQPHLKCKVAFQSFSWKLSGTVSRVDHIKLFGVWRSDNNSTGITVNEDYLPIIDTSNSITMENIPSELNLEISDKLTVIGETDAINVTGALPGENIKVYTTSGIELKSVVANDDVVNIKLPMNQIYIVKAGQTRYKVAILNYSYYQKEAVIS